MKTRKETDPHADRSQHASIFISATRRKQLEALRRCRHRRGVPDLLRRHGLVARLREQALQAPSPLLRRRRGRACSAAGPACRAACMPKSSPRFAPAARARLTPINNLESETAAVSAGLAVMATITRKSKAPRKTGALYRSRDRRQAYAAFWLSITVGPLALPLIGIERGFFASGISRTRSTCRRPFSRLAPLTWTKSASWNTRSKVRAAMP